MSWERDPLWAKARLFLANAFDQPRDDPAFGLWCSLGLEILARAALASVSPALLAEPDRDQRNLLYALNRGSERGAPKSISATQVIALCEQLFSGFTQEDAKLSRALFNRRNEELHSGAAAFDEYKSNQWLAGFYGACRSLAEAMGETLVELLGEEEATVAEEIVAARKVDVVAKVKKAIDAHHVIFSRKSENERIAAASLARENGEKLSAERHHRTTCPACECVATLQGETIGKEHVDHDDGEIIVRQAVAPTMFRCEGCGLVLTGHAELEVAGLGGQYTRRTTYTPEDFYGLVNPSDEEDEEGGWLEYDNE